MLPQPPTPGNGRHKALHFTHPPQRVVSLVPSSTESLFDLGLGAAVVGITDYCIHPEGALQNLPRLGGPKNPRVSEIVALQPDLVLANWEENTRPTVEALEAAGVPVWVTFPQTVRAALDTLWTLVGLFRSQEAALRLDTLETSVQWAQAAAEGAASPSYFCPIWYDHTSDGRPWWMTFNAHTFCHDLLALVGGRNVFAERQRRYPLEADLGPAPAEDPGEKDTRYPRLSLDEVLAAAPEVILLPSEPYAFDERHREEMLTLLADTPAVRSSRIHLVDGSLITWHGTRIGKALNELPELFL